MQKENNLKSLDSILNELFFIHPYTMTNQTSFLFNNEAVHLLLLEMAKQRSTTNLFKTVVSQLADFSNVALARIWVLKPGDICEKCVVQKECKDRSSCLHLVASAGHSAVDANVAWDRVHGRYSRFPLGARKVGHIAASGQPVIVEHITEKSSWIADFKWTEKEHIKGFAGQPLIFQGKVLGVFAVFTKHTLNQDVLQVLRVIADHIAAALANTLAFEEIEQLKDKLEQENLYLREELFDTASLGGFVGQSSELHQVFSQIEVVAPTNASVLILGESGTGKELVAREIHHRSLRKDKPLIKVNCASIPRDLFESEFFGHVRGAFTGALADRVGRFGAADGGTLFLDELGEIPLEHQSKLLRVLQEGEFERVGENRTRRTDVRIIAATNKDLQEEVNNKEFREDLYFRLNVFPIKIPPLRERIDDIASLANHFLKTILQDMNRPLQQFNTRHLQQLQQYNWPGNVRELRNVVEQAAIYANAGPLRVQLPKAAYDRCPHVALQKTAAGYDNMQESPLDILTENQMQQLQRDNTYKALKRCNWKIYGEDGAAALLGIKPTTLATRIKKMQLKPPTQS